VTSGARSLAVACISGFCCRSCTNTSTKSGTPASALCSCWRPRIREVRRYMLDTLRSQWRIELNAPMRLGLRYGGVSWQHYVGSDVFDQPGAVHCDSYGLIGRWCSARSSASPTVRSPASTSRRWRRSKPLLQRAKPPSAHTTAAPATMWPWRLWQCARWGRESPPCTVGSSGHR